MLSSFTSSESFLVDKISCLDENVETVKQILSIGGFKAGVFRRCGVSLGDVLRIRDAACLMKIRPSPLYTYQDSSDNRCGVLLTRGRCFRD